MELRKRVNCPWCGLAQYTIVDLFPVTDVMRAEKKIVRCDLEEGGCEGEFVVTGRGMVELKTHKISGLGPGGGDE